MDVLKIAIVGAGQIVRTTHLPALQTMEQAEVVAISDVNRTAAEAMATDFGIPRAFGDHIEMIKACRPDAVYVCVPNRFHYGMTMDALKLGCHVFCEKPPAVSAEQAAEMAEAAKVAGKILSYDFHLRHGSNVRYMKEKIREGAFGEVYFARAKWLRRAGVPGWGNFISKDMQGGGPLIDIGAHMIDLALYLMDYPAISYVTASSSDRIGTTRSHGFFGDWDPARYTVEDGIFGMIHFENGGCLEIESSFALNMRDKDEKTVQIYGDRMGCSIFPAELYKGDEEDFANETVEFSEDGDLHINANRNFINACLGTEEVLVTAEQGAYIQRVIEAMYRSAENNLPQIFQ